MSDEMRDREAERLLRDAAPVARLDDAAREAIWQNLQARLAPRRPRIRPFAWAAAAAALLVAGLVAFSLYPGAATQAATAVSVSGPCTFSTPDGASGALQPGNSVPPGCTLQAGRQAELVLALPDRSRIALRQNTRAVYSGPRRDGQDTLRLIKGELHARVTRGRERFQVQTPVASLRVLGTDFQCRAYSGFNGQPAQEGEPYMNAAAKRTAALSPIALLLTVLSGAVEVNTNGTSYTVSEGHRTLFTGSTQSPGVVKLAQADYSKDWLDGSAGKPQGVLFPAELVPHFLTGLRSFDPETGQVQEVTDFLSPGIEILAGFEGKVALVKASSLIFGHFGSEVIGGAGRPLINDQLYLVNLQTGEKLAVPPLADYDPLYTDLSPDGRRLAFVGSRKPSDGDREGGLYVVDLETLEVKRLLEGWFKISPHWSPDSRWLVQTLSEGYSHDLSEYRIALVDSITGEVIQTGLIGGGARFLPDGQRIVYAGGFQRSGSWMQGVLTTGNLFLASVPRGEPVQLTSLAEGGAVMPSTSPDGAHLTYWIEKRLHLLNLDTKADLELLETEGWCEAQWLDDRRVLVSPTRGGEPLRIVRLTDGPPEIKEYRAEAPELTPEAQAGMEKAADGLKETFRIYGQAIQAQDEHRIDQAVTLYARARDLMADTLKPLEAGESLPGVMLAAQDFRPYLEMLRKQAALTAPELTAKVVEDNLRYYIPSLLRTYLRSHQTLPTDLNDFATTMLNERWQINHIQAGDKPRAARLFLIPGDDPATTVTSYELVKADPEAGEWILRTPVLPDGKRLEATYKVAPDAYPEITITRTD